MTNAHRNNEDIGRRMRIVTWLLVDEAAP